MKIEYSISEIPNTEHERKYFLAYLSGNLTLTIGDDVFFSEEGILLGEFYTSVSNWIKKIEEEGVFSDFKYSTMDSDEPSILSIEHQDKSYIIKSNWSDKNKMPIEFNEFVKNFKKFLTTFKIDVKTRCNVDVDLL